MFRAYLAMGMMALGIFTYAQYTGLSVDTTEATRPAAGQSAATHK